MLRLVFNFLRQNFRKKKLIFLFIVFEMDELWTKEVKVMCYSTVAILDNSLEGKQHDRICIKCP